MAKSIEDIAADLEVSVTTVRLVLLGKARQYRISEKTEKRVRDYTDLHGAKINHTARALRLKRTDSLAMIIPRLSNHFFAELAERMEIRCRQAGLQLSISCCYDDPDTQIKLIEHFRQRNIDGLFLVPANGDIPKQAANYFDNRLVLLDRDFGFDAYPVVITSNKSCSEQLTQKLYKFARSDKTDSEFLFIAGNPRMPSINARVEGFKHALSQLGVANKDICVSEVDKNGFAEGISAMQNILQKGTKLPDVLITSSIPLLQGALQVLKHSNEGIPPQMVFATFDDHSMLDFMTNPICSVRQDYQVMINSAFDEMEKLINGLIDPRRHIAEMTIIERNM